MERLSKKLFSGLMAAAILIGVMGSSIPVMAANTSDTTYGINVESSTGSFKRVQERDKQNNTKIYVKVKKSPDMYVQVRTYGNRNTTSYYNETNGGTAVVQRGVPSSITNFCYENKKSNYTYVLAKVGFRSTSNNTGRVEGVWSPDRTQNYTVVN